MQSIAEVYYLNGSFLVFDNEHALALRKNRIIGQHIGCSPKYPHQLIKSGLPCFINHYAANIVLENKLAVFKIMTPHSESVSIENNKSLFAIKLSGIEADARKEFFERRTSELKKRRIEVSSDKIGKFDDKRIKIDISNKPESTYSLVHSSLMNEKEVANCFIVLSDKLVVFRDLYQRGFYLSMGLKFGCDFLAYQGDPVRYHAKFAIRLTANKGGHVDLVQEKYNELNALHRLCHTTKKTLALATVTSGDDDKQEVKYWTLKARDYIKPDSGPDLFETLDL